MGIPEIELYMWEDAIKPFSYAHPADSFPIGSPNSAIL